jgi:hypothetical protein
MDINPLNVYLANVINDATSLAAEYGHRAVEPIHLATVMHDLTGEVLPDPLEADLLLHLCEPDELALGQDPALSAASKAIVASLDDVDERLTEELLVSRLTKSFTAVFPAQGSVASFEYDELVVELPSARQSGESNAASQPNLLRSLMPWNRT